MTEEQARTKWCAMARIRDDDSNAQGYNRVVGGGRDLNMSRCIASDCMMWRQTNAPGPVIEVVPVEWNNGHAEKPKDFDYRTAGPKDYWIKHAKCGEGRCGLGGK